MTKVLEIQFSGWTATPRMPFILSGNAVCMHTPTYSLILGLLGCCVGRVISATEVNFGFKYRYDSVAQDLETRQRLEFDGRRIKKHTKGTDAYSREFHTFPMLTLWIDRLDWKPYFENPIGTPALGRSQDILMIKQVKEVEVEEIEVCDLGGSLLPFSAELEAGGQLVQLAEAFSENEEIGSGRAPTKSKVFLSIPHDNNSEVRFGNLYKTSGDNPLTFYFHRF